MGLDNGLKAEIKFKNGFTYTCELCYWRKCWNFRDAIFHTIKIEDGEYYSEPLNLEKLQEIDAVLTGFIKDPGPEQIWEAKTVKKIHKSNRKLLRKLILLLKYADTAAIFRFLCAEAEWYDTDATAYINKPDIIESIEFYFYDSY